MLELPDAEKSYWRLFYSGRVFEELQDDLIVDVVIIGAGITGLSAGYLLKQSGLNVAVLDKDSVGGGTTGRTTGKVTSQHSLIYHDLQKRLGQQTARIYGEANQAALRQVEEIIIKEGIDCDWQRDDNYVFTADPARLKEFEQEAETAASLGLPASFETATPLPFEIKAAVKFTNQAKMSAQKYVMGLAEAINGDGSHVFERSEVIGIKDGNPARVRTRQGRITAKAVIVATNVPTLPLIARGAYCVMEYPTESYIVAGPLSKKIKGMYISPDKRHYSILPIKVGGQDVLLVGGESHLSGLRGDKKGRYQRLADYAERNFGLPEITNIWSDRDYLSYDGPPLVGKIYPWSKNLYGATAFRKWGLSGGTVAAMILRDLIIGETNPWATVFSSNRVKPILSIPRVAAKYLTGKA